MAGFTETINRWADKIEALNKRMEERRRRHTEIHRQVTEEAAAQIHACGALLVIDAPRTLRRMGAETKRRIQADRSNPGGQP